MSKEILVATYGSLRTGQANEHVNDAAGAVSMGLGWTDKEYRLGRYGGAFFPVVTLGIPVSKVRVEIFKTDERGLRGAYDRLEGYNAENPSHGFYDRSEVPVTLDDGTQVTAWIYHIEEEHAASEVVKHGDWEKHNQR